MIDQGNLYLSSFEYSHYLLAPVCIDITGRSYMLITSGSERLLTCNLYLYYPYIIKQTDHENIQIYQVKVVILSHYTYIFGSACTRRTSFFET